MSRSIDSRLGRTALVVAHCAGMVDLVALPVWIGALVAHYGFDPQQAGGLATLFLGGVALASVVVARSFHRGHGRAVAATGFAVATLAFGAAVTRRDFGSLAVLHGAAGLAVGAALSVTHGHMARSRHPHRLFAMAGLALGIFAVGFLASTPPLIAAAGGPALFAVFGSVMAVAAAVTALAFPSDERQAHAEAPRTALAPAIWSGMVGIACMTVVQGMTFSFLERVGIERGFDRQAVNAVLIALGIVNLFPPAFAALLEKRLPARAVLLAGPPVQAAIAATVMSATGFPVYAIAASVFVAVMIFTHTFAFGLLARLEPSGRALSATPAVLMAGSAIGPVLGGTLVMSYGYGSVAIAAAVMATLAVACFARLPSAPITPLARNAVA